MNLNLRPCLVLLVFISSLALAQQKPLQIDTLYTGGAYLGPGWLYAAGDSLKFASLGLNDRKWQPADPWQRIADQKLKPGIGWMRLHFKVAKNLINRPLLFITDQDCATECLVLKLLVV